MPKFQNQEMRFDLDLETGTVLRVEMQLNITANLTDDRDQKSHTIDTVEALVIPGDKLSPTYKTALENLANGFLAEYRTYKALPPREGA